MNVRAAREGDEAAIAEVHVRSWQSAYRGQVPDAVLDGLSVEQRTRMWSQIIRESAPPGSSAFVLEDDGRVVGFAHIAPSRDADAGEKVGELTAIYVLREFWGQGGGDLLEQRAVASLREAGFSDATLWVLDGNTRAKRFYEAAGWLPDGESKIDYREGFELHEIRYTRRCGVGRPAG